MIRVRFAPSPTGNLHIGGVRTALFNYLFARARDGSFLLRIEDTDAMRSDTVYTEHIVQSLKWMGLTVDEPIVFQSRRQSEYERYFKLLEHSEAVYPCFCTPEEIQQERDLAAQAGQPYQYSRRCLKLNKEEVFRRLEDQASCTYRFKNAKQDETIAWKDMIHGNISFPAEKLDDFIIQRSDGTFTYNYCVVIDDIEMNITHVIRGDDHISNTPRQLMIYQALDKTPPRYAHVPLILGPDRKRLSKRHGACGILTFKEQGYLQEAMVNFCALMGWSWDDKTTVFTMDDLLEKFSLEKVSSSPAVFDQDKLIWLNRYYLRTLSSATIFERVIPFWEKESYPWEKIDRNILKGLVDISRERTSTLDELAQTVWNLWDGPCEYEEKSLEKSRKKFLLPGILPGLISFIQSLSKWSPDSLEKRLRSWSEEKNYKFVAVAQVLRLALTGKLVSPPIIETACLLGKETVLKRMHDLEDYLQSHR